MEQYAELHCLSNFSFLRGASRPDELVWRAAQLGYRALAITDECSLAGVVKAHVAAKQCRLHLIVGSELQLEEGIKVVALAPDRRAYSELSGLITLARRRSPKGEYRVSVRDITFHLKQCLLIWIPQSADCDDHNRNYGIKLRRIFKQRLWLGVSHYHDSGELERYRRLLKLASDLDIAMVACGDIRMHVSQRKRLHDVLTAIRLNTSVDQLGRERMGNSQRHLRKLERLNRLYPPALLQQSVAIANRCHFSMDELRYEYPRELVPENLSASDYLRQLVANGARQRWPLGVPDDIKLRIARELELIEELSYEYYFLTVYDIVRFAREQKILCQGRGSAANSVVCYCLFITEISPEKISLLFERFISRERDEPPDIDVDFEHERREEVIQYIYQKYSRRRAALAATVITYRSRSAVRDVGKALGLDPVFIDDLARSLAWWDRKGDLKRRFRDQGLDHAANGLNLAELFHELVQEILGFPRHLSQHVGGFVITESQISTLVPVENASMPDRTVIQWDKEDIEALGLLKVDVLALGMLSAIRKTLEYVHSYDLDIKGIDDVPAEDPATYHMLQQADSVGVFQIESRAQMSMLPRLKPQCFYDLVIEIAIVRPGPIQGDMVHPYLRRRQGLEPVSYPSPAIKSVLERTLGVPIFQEQAIKLAMVAAGFSGGEADQLRRAMASWGKNGNLTRFEDKLINGMRERGYSDDFATRLFEQIKGFGGYGFPESHSASFALLAYVSAWLKCHHPAAFYCGLLNSQPMGFYTPSQLVQDARRHKVPVAPVDVTLSSWNHRLFWPDQLSSHNSAQQPCLRLGLRLVKGFSEAAAQRLVDAREMRPFKDVDDLRKRARLDKGEMEKLAGADALASLSGHRHQSQWQILALEQTRPLLESGRYNDKKELDDGINLPAPAVAEEVLADYQSTGLSLRPHPMKLLRGQFPFSRCKRHIDLGQLNNGRFVKVAGIVTGRQRPSSASGVLFLTLEDETGNTNVVVWNSLQERCRQALLTSRLLLVKGVVETKDNVIHLVAGDLIDHSEALQGLATHSRDFR